MVNIDEIDNSAESAVDINAASAAAFDLGVFLAVLGAVMLSLESFSRLARRAHVEDSEYAMDIDPSREDDAAATATALNPGKEG